MLTEQQQQQLARLDKIHADGVRVILTTEGMAALKQPYSVAVIPPAKAKQYIANGWAELDE